MNKKRISIRVSDPQSLICAAPTLTALKLRFPDFDVGFSAPESIREASTLVPGSDFFVSEKNTANNDNEMIIDLTAGSGGLDQESPRWKAYLEAIQTCDMGNPYHKLDLFRKVAQVDQIDVNFELLSPTPNESISQSLEHGGLKIGLCVTTLSQLTLQSTIQSLSELPFPCVIYLLGTIKDRRTSNELVKTVLPNGKIFDLCGHLSLAGNAQMFHGVDMAIAGPGLSALLSSGYGTFTLCLDENPEKGPLHYPYGHGHLIFQSHSGASSDDFAPIVKECAAHAVIGQGGTLPSLEQWQEFADDRLAGYLSKIRIMGTQRVETILSEEESYTELSLRPLLYLGAEYYDVIQTFYRLLWEHSLNQRTITTQDLQIMHQDTLPALCQLLKPLEKLYELANFGCTYSNFIRDSLLHGNLERAKVESKRLEEVEGLIQSVGSTYSALKLLCVFHNRLQDLLTDENPIELAAEMAQVFTELKSRVLVFLDLEKSLFHTTFHSEASLVTAAGEKGISDG